MIISKTIGTTWESMVQNIKDGEYSFLNGSNFEVRLLISELKEARKLASVFRQAGIIPHVYEDFATFYKDSLQSNEHSMTVIDVKKMSQGVMKLKGHPAVRNKSMHLAFYYTDETAPLLYSAYEIFNYGLIKKVDDYRGQVKSLLTRYNLFKFKDYQIQALNCEKEELRKANQDTFQQLESYKENTYYSEHFFKIIDVFEKEKNNISFFEACEDAFSQIGEISEYAYLELSPNGHKLVSPPSGSKKLRKLPSLWLGQGLKDGIEFFAQNMANQVALEILGSDIMCLMVKGRFKSPEVLLFVKASNEDFINKFKWDALETYLSNVYSFFMSKGYSESVQENGYLDSFSFLNKLDDNRFGEKGNEDLYLVDINLQDLVQMIASKNEIRFFWKEFLNDFIRYFKGKYNGDFYYTSVNPSHISFLVDSERSEIFLRSAKEFVKRFSYWKYFEDRDAVFTRDIEVFVRSLPVSSCAFLAYVNNQESLYSPEKIKPNNALEINSLSLQ